MPGDRVQNERLNPVGSLVVVAVDSNSGAS